jgi:hypothetical protein
MRVVRIHGPSRVGRLLSWSFGPRVEGLSRKKAPMEDRWSAARRLHLLVTASLGAAVLTFAVLVAAGTLEVRVGREQLPTAPPPVPATPKEREGPWIREVEDARPYFDLLGQTARLYRYKGGWIDAWIDVEVEGQKTVLGKELGKQLREGHERDDRVGPAPSGYLLWVRRKEHDKNEVWELALSLSDKDGKKLAWSYLTESSPPQPKSGRGMEASGLWVRGADGTVPLNEGQAVVLDGFRNGGERETRKVELKCMFVKWPGFEALRKVGAEPGAAADRPRE